ncbi:MAG: DNA repair protein RadC [Patescibacteria group bacterium]|nr:DNA repair protein RadC [Patescibacteria group bacterium]MDE2172413.1 DNA repair protein RadC [Patescibacteria group bacterium]
MHKTYRIDSQFFASEIQPIIRYNGRAFNDYRYKIGDLPSEEKPREKLLAQGPESLSTRELAVLILVTGTTKEGVIEMADRLIKDYGERNIFEERDPEKLSKELDIPIVKACQIVAVGELGRRVYDKSKTSAVTIKNARDVYEYMTDMRNLPKEHMRALYLNSHGRIIRDQVVSIGTVNASLANPREVFNPAIDLMASAVILAHNHPSGELAPSDEDVMMTERLVQAGKILGIPILDHVIIAKDGFVSVKANY